MCPWNRPQHDLIGDPSANQMRLRRMGRQAAMAMTVFPAGGQHGYSEDGRGPQGPVGPIFPSDAWMRAFTS